MMGPQTVTAEQIEAEIASESYFTAADGVRGASGGRPGASLLPEYATHAGGPLSLLTFCVLVLRNGFTVTGQSACADPAKFNADKGRELAREDAVDQCWKFLGFRLRDKLAAAPQRKLYERKDIVYTRASVDQATGMNCIHALFADGHRVAAMLEIPLRTPSIVAEDYVIEAVLREANEGAA